MLLLPISSQWGNTVSDTHWQVQWVPTLNGNGVTEPGLSGSPIFDLNKHVVGTLTGGGSDCSTPTVNDYYGQIAYDWSSNGSTANKRLQDWLDPGATGAQTFDGQYAPCTPALAFDAGVLSCSAIQHSLRPECGSDSDISEFWQSAVKS
jgi:hypothetical protein